MSCLQPLHIYNKSILLNSKASAALLEVPCNSCPNCQDTKTLEYKFRAYYEWQDTLKKGGFAYMETLTYNEESMRKRTFHGIRCFKSEDIRLLFKKLRNRCGDNYSFRYFLSSEYGGLYKRPHYHVIFYVIPHVDEPLTTSLCKFYRYVKESWTEPVLNKFGKPVKVIKKNGLVYTKTRSLGFIDKFSSLLSRMITRVDGMQYVAKYVVKEDNYVSEVEARFNELIEHCVNDSVKYNELLEEKRKALPFHRQSQGFGNSITPDLILDINRYLHEPVFYNLRISNSAIPLPLYYIRKLFYKLQPAGYFNPETGKECKKWIPTAIGREFELIQKTKQIERYTDKYYNSLANFFIYLEDGAEKAKEVYKLLGNRSLEDFIIYKLVYKGHLHNNYAFATDGQSWKEFFIESKKIGDMDNWSYDHCKRSKEDFRKYLRDNCINETINPIWKDFDIIDDYFIKYFKAKSDFIISDREYLFNVKQKLKLLHKL